MGSGLNFFTNAIDKTPLTADIWTDVDCSADIPSGSTGVILDIHNTSSLVYSADVRKKGSTDDFYANGSMMALSHLFVIVGVDENRIFEAKVGEEIVLYLVGYTDENVVIQTNVTDKSTGTTGQWVDTDCSAEVPSGATGLILRMVNTGAVLDEGGVRNNGSSDTRKGDIRPYSFIGCLIGCDSGRIFEQYIETTAIDCKLVGYTKPPVTMFVNAIDKSIGATGAWTDIDVTTDTESACDGVILELKHNSNVVAYYIDEVRKNGSSDARQASAKVTPPIYSWRHGFVGVDVDNIFENYIDNLVNDVFLLGYCKPAVEVTPKSFSDSGVGADVFVNPFRAMGFNEVGGGSDIFGIPFKAMEFSDVASGVDAFSVLLQKAFIDAGYGSDAFTKELIGFIEKTFSDAASGIDNFNTPFKALTFSDVGQGTDVFIIPFKAFSFSDLATGVDAFVVLLQKYFVDVGSGSDVFSKQILEMILKSFSDAGVATEVFTRKNIMVVTLPAIIGITEDGKIVIALKRKVEAQS